jgi:DNA repair exonuclease SbcCD nuclease subunit
MNNDFTFVHAADVHLDSPLSGLARKDQAFSELVRGATRRAFTNVADLAIAEGAAFLVIAGDLYDGAWRDQGTGQFVVRELGRLARAGVRSFVVFGNHDAESRITRHLSPPDGVRFFGHRACETAVLPDIGVAIHGRSYRDAATTEDLAATYCPPNAMAFNIAVLHTALGGSPPHENYAPCSLDQLCASGHQYWALGHVHEHAVRSAHPFVVFPGNTQGRHVREAGAKGAVLVRVVEGQVRSVEHRACDEVRFAHAHVDAAAARDGGELLDAAGHALAQAWRGAQGRPMAVRLSIEARGPAARAANADRAWFDAEVQARAAALSEDLWAEKVTLSEGTQSGPSGLPQEMEDLLATALEDEDCARLVRAAIAPLLGKLPSDVGDNEGLTPLLSAARARDDRTLVAAAKALVAARLDSPAP